MGTKINSLSVFFPAYNEEKNIAQTIKQAILALQVFDSEDFGGELSRTVAQTRGGTTLRTWEIIVVDDGSTDGTGQVVKDLQKQDSHIRLITHSPNKGYGEALKTGFYNSKYDWIAFTDSDGQFDFSEITKFLEQTDQAQVVVGYRINRQDNFIRKLFGWSWTFLANLLLNIKVKDVDCGFKLIKKEVIEKIPHLQSTRGGMISPELLAKAKKAGFKIVEVGVHHYPRKEGQQSGASIGVIIKSFVDLFSLWRSLL